jgi:hypothetical protein
MLERYKTRTAISPSGKAFRIFGITKEVAFIREILAWINGPKSHTRVQSYEIVLLETEANALENFRKLLLKTTRFRNKTPHQISAIIDEKTKSLERALQELDRKQG